MRPPNDPLQYDDLAGEWWRPRGAFASLHWLAVARARLVPPPAAGSLLLDLGCGGGLLAPHLAGYRHVGVDLGNLATQVAREHGVTAVRGDITRLPIRDACADVVVAGEIFEHVRDLGTAVAESVRVLKPGGTLVCDTLADTWLCKLLLITLAERLPVVPKGIHDADLLVDRQRLQVLCRAHGVELTLNGLRPRVTDLLAWVLRLRRDVRLVPTRWTGAVFQGAGVKR